MKKIIFTITTALLIYSCGNEEQKNTVPVTKKEVLVPVEKTEEITYKEFKVNYDSETQSITPYLITDLPKQINVNITVSRSYWEKNDEFKSEYAVEYFSETHTIEEWSNQINIPLNDTEWNTKLSLKQNEMAEIGLGFDVKNVSDSIEIYAVIPSTNKPFPKLLNSKMSASSIKFQKKLGVKIKNVTQYANYLELKKGVIYNISNEVPLMPYLNPSDPIDAISLIQKVNSNQFIEVLTLEKKNNTPWYKVNILNENLENIGQGWINSVALIGKKIKIIND